MIKERYALILIILLGALLRFSMAYFAPVEQDEEIYSYNAWEIMEGKGVFQSEVQRSPVYFYSVIGFYKILGVSLFSARLLSVLASTMTVLAVYYISRQIKDGLAALVASALFAFSPFTLRYSYIALTEPYQWFFLSFSLFFFISALKKNSLRYLAISGILIAVAAGVRRSSLAVPIGLFFYLLVFRYEKGLKTLIKEVTTFTASVVLPFGVPLYLAFIKIGGEGLKRFITFKGSEIGHYQDPWWIGIQMSWYAPLLLLGLTMILFYLLYSIYKVEPRKHLIGFSILIFAFILRTSTSWQWGKEVIFLLGGGTLFILLYYKKYLPIWSYSASISLMVSVSYIVYMGSFLKVVIYITLGALGLLTFFSYSYPRHSGVLTAIVISPIIYLYLIKPEPDLQRLLLIILTPLILSTSLLIPFYKREFWSSEAVVLGIAGLMFLSTQKIPSSVVLLLFFSVMLLYFMPWLKSNEVIIKAVASILTFSSLVFLGFNLFLYVSTIVITLTLVLAGRIKRNNFYYSFLLIPLALLYFHPSFEALSAISFLYLSLVFIKFIPLKMKIRSSGALGVSALSTLGFYLRYAIMLVYTYEFTVISSVFSGVLFTKLFREKRFRALLLASLLLSTSLTVSLYATSPFFVRSSPDQNPYMSTVREVAEVIDKKTQMGDYILAWHTFAVEAERKTIIKTSNANYYPIKEILRDIQEKNVTLFVNDYYLNKLLFNNDQFRRYIVENFTSIKEIEGIQIYEKTQFKG